MSAQIRGAGASQPAREDKAPSKTDPAAIAPSLRPSLCSLSVVPLSGDVLHHYSIITGSQALAFVDNNAENYWRARTEIDRMKGLKAWKPTTRKFIERAASVLTENPEVVHMNYQAQGVGVRSSRLIPESDIKVDEIAARILISNGLFDRNEPQLHSVQ